MKSIIENTLKFMYLMLFIRLLVSLQVSIIAAVPCRYLYWQRSSLEYLFVRETYLATVIATLVATDITNKLYMMNNKVCILFKIMSK